MICGTKCKIKKKEEFEVKCKNTTINSTTEVKYLGVKIDETLSGKGIINTILKNKNKNNEKKKKKKDEELGEPKRK